MVPQNELPKSAEPTLSRLQAKLEPLLWAYGIERFFGALEVIFVNCADYYNQQIDPEDHKRARHWLDLSKVMAELKPTVHDL